MSPQGISRKRPAPGTVPTVNPQTGSIPNYPQGAAGTQLSNDQFLQWGQNSNVVNPATFADQNPYNNAAYSSNQDLPVPAANQPNQVSRRQTPNQLVSRNRGYEQPPTVAEGSGNPGENGGWGESLDELYRRASVAKRDAQAKRKQIPPFVQKLSSFLDESKNTDLIRWSDDGNSFIVLDEDEFAKTLIPELFKHNNYASFVRQLNMYGFHKKVGLSDNSMRASERKNKSPSEYANPYFKRGHPDLLWLIQKPKNSAGQGAKPGKPNVRVKTEEGEDNENEDYDEGAGAEGDDRARNRQLSLITNNNSMPKEQFSGVYRELQAIRQQQQIISNTITKLRREHEQLYAQAANFQEQHSRHENSINAILTFLATVYNRSLQGQEGPQNIANSFAGAISGDQGNVVDVGDGYPLDTLGGSNITSPSGRSMKKQPLLLKAPPTTDQSRAPTLSPAAGSYDHTQPRGHSRQPSATQPGHVEEVFDNSPRQQEAQPPVQPQQHFPSRDILSVIQNSNARNGIGANFSDFPNALSSLETSNGNAPLTPGQRADMLRLMANESGNNNNNIPASQNNALMTPNPPPMPHNYSGRLANTRAEIDNLVKMQAEQDRSVQNLTNLLQPLSPTGTIPGVGADGNVPPPPLDLDSIFNNDYFTDLGDLEQNKNNLEYGNTEVPATSGAGNTVPTTAAPDTSNDLFDFDHIPDEELFGGSSQGQNPNYYGGYDGSSYGHAPNTGGGSNQHLAAGNEPGRVVETLTDSEASPANTVDDGTQYNGDEFQGDKGNAGGAKRRRKA